MIDQANTTKTATDDAVLSLGGIESLNGSCPDNSTDERLEEFLAQVVYVSGRPPITVQQLKDRRLARSQPEPVPELTPAEKLAASGLTVEELKELLGLE
jgi:hypothetical protein